MNRGYFAIGIESPKSMDNIGTLWRTANLFNAALLFTIGKRYKDDYKDTLKSYRHIPLMHFNSINDLIKSMPENCQLIGVEQTSESKAIVNFKHPQRAFYLLGAEDFGMSKEALNACNEVIQLPGKHALNVSVAGSIVLYDRIIKQSKK